jgi:hypothetical protein
MSPLELLAWVGAICASILVVAVTAAIVVGCVKAIRGTSAKSHLRIVTPSERGGAR